jgi:hypothetical protein
MKRYRILACVALGLAGPGLWAPVDGRAGEPLRLEVRETAGLRRFAYPVSAEFPADWTAQDGDSLRLRDAERTVPAQFTCLEPAQGERSALWAADFSLDLAPLEIRMLVIEHDPAGKPPPLQPGLQVERRAGALQVRSKLLSYVVPDDLQGLLRAMRVAGDDWIGPSAEGLVIGTRDGLRVPLRAPAEAGQPDGWRVVKPGPLAVTLERRWTQPLDERRQLACGVRLDIPLGKSWIRVDWSLDDPTDLVASQSAAIRLRLDAPARQPILADVGAGGWTYAALRPGETLVYRGGGGVAGQLESHSADAAWRVERASEGKIEPLAVSTVPLRSTVVPGWAHLSDAQRATAIAMHQFGSQADSMELGADGRVGLARAYALQAQAQGAPKQLRFWLHFVAAPAQWGAATSPQSMLAPPEVRVVAPASETDGQRPQSHAPGD